MDFDLQKIVEIYSRTLELPDEISLILIALTFAYVVMIVWAIDRRVQRSKSPTVKTPRNEIFDTITDDTPHQASTEEDRGSVLDQIQSTEEIQDVVVTQVQTSQELKEVVPPQMQPEAPQNLSTRLTKTRTGFFDRIRSVFSSKPKLEPEMLEELEYLLVSSDLGIKTVTKLMDEVKGNLERGVEVTEELLIDQLKDKLRTILGSTGDEIIETITPGQSSPLIVLMVGVNGVGKTTTCAKLAARLKERGLSVMLVAADTFRAAAVMQLTTWGERLGVPVISGAENAKPQAVVFDAMEEAKRNHFDVILIDTAGRLHTKTSLMQELEGVKHTVQRHFPSGPQEVILVVDGSTGQNALNQAQEFNEAVTLTGLIVTKLDGTPKGGIVVAIRESLSIPVRYIGVGESHHDLRPFVAPEFVDALFDRADSKSSEKISAHGETRRRKRRGDDLPAVNH